MSIIYTLIIFSLIIFIHELGHFAVARMCGVRVIEFSLGMGPAIFKYQGPETLYALRLLPIGGYAAMEGENGEFGEYDAAKTDDENNDNLTNDKNEIKEITNETDDISLCEEDTEHDEVIEDEVIALENNDVTTTTLEETLDKSNSKSFSDKSVIQRILICVAGPLMNLVLAFILILATLWGATAFSTTTIAGFKENSTTNLTGLREYDTITKINGVSILTDRDIVYEVLRDYDLDGIFDMEVLRDQNKIALKGVTFDLVMPEPDANGVVDESATPSIYFDFYVTKDDDVTMFKKIQRSFFETYSLCRSSILSVGDLIAGRVPFSELSGPVGVGTVVGQAAKISLSTLVNLAAMISVSIGIFNLLPFPALDGGRIVFYIIEGVTGKKVSPKIEGYINAGGMLILLSMMIAVTFKDISNLF